MDEKEVLSHWKETKYLGTRLPLSTLPDTLL